MIATTAPIVAMHAALAKQHTYTCGVHDASGSDMVTRMANGDYKIDLRSGDTEVYTPQQIGGLMADQFAMIDLCSTGGTGESPLNLTTVTDSGKLQKFGLGLHAYRVVGGSDVTRWIVTVRVDANHRPIEVMVRDQHGSHTLEYGSFNGVMTHQ